MEQIIPVIIIALISLFFRKKGGGQPEKRHPQKRTIQFPAHHDKVDDEYEQYPRPAHSFPSTQLAKAKSLKEAADTMLSRAQPAFEEKKAEVDKQLDELKKEEERFRARAKTIQKQAEHTEVKKNELLQFHQEDIIKGIVMAEVLGPPRAKKPYRR